MHVIIETECVYCAVRSELLTIIGDNFVFERTAWKYSQFWSSPTCIFAWVIKNGKLYWKIIWLRYGWDNFKMTGGVKWTITRILLVICSEVQKHLLILRRLKTLKILKKKCTVILEIFCNFPWHFTVNMSEMYVYSFCWATPINLIIHSILLSPDSSVGIATRYGLGGPGIESR